MMTLKESYWIHRQERNRAYRAWKTAEWWGDKKTAGAERERCERAQAAMDELRLEMATQAGRKLTKADEGWPAPF
jgi:hypothetical protein